MKAIIYKPAKTPMQSGKGNTKKWLLEFERESRNFNNNIIGWVGSSDMNQEIRLHFDSKEDAVQYAKDNKIKYEIIEPKERKTVIRAYSDNFK